MTAKTGLTPQGSSNCCHWKSDQSGPQILFFRGFTQGELMRFFLSPKNKYFTLFNRDRSGFVFVGSLLLRQIKVDSPQNQSTKSYLIDDHFIA